MKKKKILHRLYIFFLTIAFSHLAVILGYSAQLKIESFNVLSTDITARTSPRKDLNDNYCALVKVILPIPGCKFQGNLIGDPVFNVSEYWVYLSQGTKQFQILCPWMTPLMVDLTDPDNGMGLESSTTYQLMLSGYEGLIPGNVPETESGKTPDSSSQKPSGPTKESNSSISSNADTSKPRIDEILNETKPVYYDLSGKVVTELQEGQIYIKRENGKTEKIIYKKETPPSPESDITSQIDDNFKKGKAQWKDLKKQLNSYMVSPDKANLNQITTALLEGYQSYMKVLDLENRPGIKQKYTKEIQKAISENHWAFYEFGSSNYVDHNYYPEAFESFMIYGDIPGEPLLGNFAPQIPDTIRANSYFNAGLSAWSADNVDEAARAFSKARQMNYPQPEACIYEIACWQNIASRDIDHIREKEAADHIYTAAKAGYEKFGMAQPIFLNNMVNSMLNLGKENDAINVVSNAIRSYPNKASLYGLRAFIYDRMGNEASSEADYRQAASMSDVDYETMLNATKKILRIGQEKWNNIELGDPDIVAKKKDVRTNYFEVAKKYAEKAKTLTDDPSSVDYLMESIDYNLSL